MFPNRDCAPSPTIPALIPPTVTMGLMSSPAIPREMTIPIATITQEVRSFIGTMILLKSCKTVGEFFALCSISHSTYWFLNVTRNQILDGNSMVIQRESSISHTTKRSACVSTILITLSRGPRTLRTRSRTNSALRSKMFRADVEHNCMLSLIADVMQWRQRRIAAIGKIVLNGVAIARRHPSKTVLFLFIRVSGANSESQLSCDGFHHASMDKRPT